jgi:hypothetical protein
MYNRYLNCPWALASDSALGSHFAIVELSIDKFTASCDSRYYVHYKTYYGKSLIGPRLHLQALCTKTWKLFENGYPLCVPGLKIEN